MFRIVLYSLLFLLVFTACQETDNRSPLRIATCSSMKLYMDSVTTLFTQQEGIACQVIVGSSGKLCAQIAEGAPYDVFVSADTLYTQHLYRNGACLKPQTVAVGQLVFLTHETQPVKFPAWCGLNGRIALPNPVNAPYGKAAVEVLQYLNADSCLKKQLIYAESVAQTNQYFVSRSVTSAFTSASFDSTSVATPMQRLLIPTAWHNPIIHDVAVLHQADQDVAAAFKAFLNETNQLALLSHFGFAATNKRNK